MIIGVSGKKGTGKDTLAQILVELGYERLKFATHLVEGVSTLNPVVGLGGVVSSRCRLWWLLFSVVHRRLPRVQDVIAWFGYDASKKLFPEYRRLLQVFGTEVGRELFGENVWVEKLIGSLEGLDKVVVSDVRFPNEVRALKERGAVLIKIVSERTAADEDSHPSEIDLEDENFHYIIDNSGTVEDLRVKVLSLVNLLESN